MAYVRKYNHGPQPYYALVESYRDENGKPRQRVLQWLGTDPTPKPQPEQHELTPLDFGDLAIRLMQNTLTPDDVFTLLEQLGQPTKLDQLEAIGIHFEFVGEKLVLSLYPPGSSSPPQQRAPPAKRRSQS